MFFSKKVKWMLWKRRAKAGISYKNKEIWCGLRISYEYNLKANNQGTIAACTPLPRFLRTPRVVPSRSTKSEEPQDTWTATRLCLCETLETQNASITHQTPRQLFWQPHRTTVHEPPDPHLPSYPARVPSRQSSPQTPACRSIPEPH